MVNNSAMDDPIRQDARVKAMKDPRWNHAGFSWQVNIIDENIMSLWKQKALLFNQIEGLLWNLTDAEQRFIATPISEYTDTDHQLWTINPDLMAKSKLYDDLVSQIWQTNNDMVNLTQAKDEMMTAVNAQKTAVNKWADSSKAWTALNKALQIWDAQGTAGMQWATAWQLNKAQAEIGNKFAPQFADIEAQRQQWLGQAAQLEAGIPTSLSAIGWQNTENRYKNSLTSQNWRWNQSSSVLPTTKTNQVYNPTTGMYEDPTTTTPKKPAPKKWHRWTWIFDQMIWYNN